jgi:hypothetical protein
VSFLARLTWPDREFWCLGAASSCVDADGLVSTGAVDGRVSSSQAQSSAVRTMPFGRGGASRLGVSITTGARSGDWRPAPARSVHDDLLTNIHCHRQLRSEGLRRTSLILVSRGAGDAGASRLCLRLRQGKAA